MQPTRPRLRSSFCEFQTEHSAAHELPYWEFLDDHVVLADGTLVLAWTLQGIALESLDSDEINQKTLHLRSVLNSLPDGCEISLVSQVNSDFDELLNRHDQTTERASLVRALTEERIAYLKFQAQKNYLLKRRLLLFLYKRLKPLPPSEVGSFFSPPEKFQQLRRADYENNLKELRQLGAGIVSGFNGCGIKSQPLTTQEAWGLTYRFLNPGRALHQPAPPPQTQHRGQEFKPSELELIPALTHPSPRQQLLFSDFVLSYDSFFCDGKHHRVITLKTQPEFTHAALVSRLMQLPFPHSLHVHLVVPEQSRELSLLQAKRRMAHSMALSTAGRPNDLQSEAKLNSTEDLLRELINSGQKLFYFQLAILLQANSKEELDLRTKRTLALLRELNGAEGLSETVAGFKVWKTLLPFGNTTLVRAKRVKTDNLADFLPLYQVFEGSDHPEAKPVCLFQNRQGGIVHYDPFDPSLPNFNCLVTGSSGSGKSFVNNLILLQYVSQNPLTFVIDIGGSYRKLCEFLNGQYIEISPPATGEAVTAINPFHLQDGKLGPSARKLKFLLALLESVLTDEEGQKLHKLDKSLLEESILSTYTRTSTSIPTLSDLLATLRASAHPLLHNFASMLYPWTGDRPYGQLLDRASALSVEKSFVVFDLKGLSQYPDLQAVMVLIITDFILGRIDTARDQRKQILMDECWELLKSRTSTQFMEYCVRTLRKTGSGITFITQGLEEIVQSPIGPALLSNTATKFILMQRGDLDPTSRLLKLNAQEKSLIASLRQVKGRYSEAFMVANDNRAVIRACPTPTEYWLATSDAQDNDLLEKERAKRPHDSLLAVIQSLARRYPFGASGGNHAA